MFSIPTSKIPQLLFTLAARLQAEALLIAKCEDLQKINKNGEKNRDDREREGSGEIYMARKEKN